jgi:phosphoribosyl-ATP pyrophosphohydrolase
MNQPDILKQIDDVLEARKQQCADESYVASLYAKGVEGILKKVAEESAETLMAAKDADRSGSQDDKNHLVYEVADLWFHTMVLLAQQNLSSEDVTNELQRRFGLSGHTEKANRG